MNIGKIIYKARKKKNLTQKKLVKKAKNMGFIPLTDGCISHIERGTRLPSAPTIKAICGALGLDPGPMLKAVLEIKIKGINEEYEVVK